MPRQRDMPDKLKRSMLRRIETFSRRALIGGAVIGKRAKPVEEAVRIVADRLGVSESTVFHAVSLGRKIDALARSTLEEGITERWPTTIALVFLFDQLCNGPRRATEIQARARQIGISDRALRCVFREFRFRHHRVGGRYGHSVWELPENKLPIDRQT